MVIKYITQKNGTVKSF